MKDKNKVFFTDSDMQGEEEVKGTKAVQIKNLLHVESSFYSATDYFMFSRCPIQEINAVLSLETLDNLLKRDKQRIEDGLPEKIKLGKLIRPAKKGGKDSVVIVPTTTEEKFYHDSFNRQEQSDQGGVGEGEEGEVLGESPQESEKGNGNGPGDGSGGEHGINQDPYEIGKILTEKFKLPNLDDKTKKIAIPNYKYDLNDRFKGSGQILDKKETLKQIIKTNLSLGRINPDNINTEGLLVSPRDKVYRVLSREQEYESQAVVFFLRDYSGSMGGEPTKAVVTLHLLIYCFLLYQYNKQVIIRFILHDTDAKEVPDLNTYYNSSIGGGTIVAPAYQLVNEIIEKESLEKDYNIYVFHGTDGDDWSDGEDAIKELTQLAKHCSRIGISVTKNAYNANADTKVEQYLNASGILEEYFKNLRLDSFMANGVTQERLIECISWFTEE